MKNKVMTGIFAVICGVLLSIAGPAQAESLRIVGLGDSLMAGFELPPEDAFPVKLEAELRNRGHDVTIANAGVSGDTSSGGLSRLEWSVPDGTDAVLLELGGNDALRGISPDQTRANLDKMIGKLKARDIEVLLIGMMAPPNMGPDYANQFNGIYPDLAKAHGVALYPFFLDGVAAEPGLDIGDGIHPNGKGVDVMVERFLPYAEALLSRIEPAKTQ